MKQKDPDKYQILLANKRACKRAYRARIKAAQQVAKEKDLTMEEKEKVEILLERKKRSNAEAARRMREMRERRKLDKVLAPEDHARRLEVRRAKYKLKKERQNQLYVHHDENLESEIDREKLEKAKKRLQEVHVGRHLKQETEREEFYDENELLEFHRHLIEEEAAAASEWAQVGGGCTTKVKWEEVCTTMLKVGGGVQDLAGTMNVEEEDCTAHEMMEDDV